MSEAKKLSQDNAFVSDLVLRQHVCPSRDNQNDQRQQKRQPTAVDPAEGKLPMGRFETISESSSQACKRKPTYSILARLNHH